MECSAEGALLLQPPEDPPFRTPGQVEQSTDPPLTHLMALLQIPGGLAFLSQAHL